MPNDNHKLIPLIKRGETEQWVDARTLHRFLQIGKDFSNWIKDYIRDFEFVEGRDYSPYVAKSTGGRQAIEYSITLDMGKHLAMLQRSERGMRARQYFIECEKELRQVQNALLRGYDDVDHLLSKCENRVHNGEIYYAATQLLRICGKLPCKTPKLKMMSANGNAVKLPSGAYEKWYIKKESAQELLCIRPGHHLGVAVVNLLSFNH